MPVPAREGFLEEEQPSYPWENDEQLLDMAGRGLVFEADGTACTMAGKQESESTANGIKFAVSRVTGTDEAGDVGRALKVVERGPGFLPRTLEEGSYGEVVSKGEAGTGLCCEGREGDRRVGRRSERDRKWGEGVHLRLLKQDRQDRHDC